MKRYIRSSTYNYIILLPEMQHGDDYELRKDIIDTEIASVVDTDGVILVGDEDSSLYQTVSLTARNESGKYQITEFVNGEPSSHQTGDCISELLEKFFASHKVMKRVL